MFIEMIDLLRCTNAHEDTWLVASFSEVTNRIVTEATLGCPICKAKYEIRNGVVDFSRGENPADHERDRARVTHSREELATRAGAYLDASQPGATIVLGGLWAHAARDLAEMADSRVIALNPPREVKESERVGLMRVADKVPLADASVQGVALDAWFPQTMVEEAARVTRAGGRVAAATNLSASGNLMVLAHDEHYWVAENPPQIVSLKRSTLGAAQ